MQREEDAEGSEIPIHCGRRPEQRALAVLDDVLVEIELGVAEGPSCYDGEGSQMLNIRQCKQRTYDS